MRVRYYGHFGLSSGFGKAATEYALALARHTKIDLELRAISRADVDPETDPRFAELVPLLDKRGPAPDVVLVHTVAHDCARVLDLEQIPDDVPAIAYTTWEGRHLPDALAPGLDSFRRVLTPSEASLRAMQPRFDLSSTGRHRVGVVPHTFDVGDLTRFHNMAALRDRRPTDPFTFLYVGAWNKRKNVDGLIRAFAHAFGWWKPGLALGFGHERPPLLYLHCPGASPVAFKMAMASTGLDGVPVLLKTQPISELAMGELMNMADVFVTASHGEAWGLPAFDALLVKRHVIYPGGEGMDDFLFATSARAVRGFEQPCALDTTAEIDGGRVKMTVTGPKGMTSEDRWIEPDLLDLSAAMLYAYQHQVTDLDVKYDVVDEYRHETIATLLQKELENP